MNTVTAREPAQRRPQGVSAGVFAGNHFENDPLTVDDPLVKKGRYLGNTGRPKISLNFSSQGTAGEGLDSEKICPDPCTSVNNCTAPF